MTEAVAFVGPGPEIGTRSSRVSLPSVSLPRAPSASVLWRRGLVVLWVLFGLLMLDRLTTLLANYWFFQSVGMSRVFWTNFWTQALLWVVSGSLVAGAIILPAYFHPLADRTRRFAIHVGLFSAAVLGYHYMGTYRTWLLFAHATPFHQSDPLYHHDIGFYAFQLGALKSAATVLTWVTLLALVSSVSCAWITRPRPRPTVRLGRVAQLIGTCSTTCTRLILSAFAVCGAVDVWLTRYDLLFKNNSAKSVHTGAAYIDVRGFFSTRNFITVEALATLASAIFVYLRLRALHQAGRPPLAGPPSPDGQALPEGQASPEGQALPEGQETKRLRATVLIPAIAPGLIIVLLFAIILSIRNMTQVKPNEPVIQLPYIQRHVDATLAGWGLTKIETREYRPPSAADPPPDINKLIASPTFSNGNAPLWPGFTSYLEQLVDPQHAARYEFSGGDPMVYGPSLDVFNEQQELRNYYDVDGVDTVRYQINGQPHLFVAAARELPTSGQSVVTSGAAEPPTSAPPPWLQLWGQKYLLYTHGYGLIMAPLGQATSTGFPAYASQNIPPVVSDPALATKQPAIYYGEDSKVPAFSDVRKVPELDYPTSQGRAQVEFPRNVQAGVKVDSLLKRIVFGWQTRNFFQVVFSGLITRNSRIHYFRPPLQRAEKIAPFLYIDTNLYPVSAEGRITWMLNGMTITNRYPYSLPEWLGDKADERSTNPRPQRHVNYARDAVKITVDAYTGAVRLYTISDDPVMRAWEKVYPTMFLSKAAMPTTVRQQVQYPIHLFHTQFDDVYHFYHMKDALTFFNFEDAWDDGNEVLGPILSDGLSITFSIEPFYWIAQTGQTLPASSVDQQFAMSGVFTNEQALNVRALPTVYMTGSDYGKLSVLTVPKGLYITGPEQAEAAIDQDPFIAQQIGFWNRAGDDIIRGHMSTVVVNNELVYLEAFFIRSKQIPIPQLKRVVVVIRGKPAMGRTLTEALQLAGQPGEVGIPAGPQSFNLED